MRAHVRTVRLTEGGGQVQYSTSTRELTMAGRGSEVAGVDQYQWERLPDMSNARCYTTGAYHQGKLYVLGTYVRGVGSSKRECTTRRCVEIFIACLCSWLAYIISGRD